MMIPADLTTFFMVPVLLHLAAILLLWFYYLVRDPFAARATGKNRIYRCQVCEHVYLDARDVPLARCSRCGALNEAVRT